MLKAVPICVCLSVWFACDVRKMKSFFFSLCANFCVKKLLFCCSIFCRLEKICKKFLNFLQFLFFLLLFFCRKSRKSEVTKEENCCFFFFFFSFVKDFCLFFTMGFYKKIGVLGCKLNQIFTEYNVCFAVFFPILTAFTISTLLSLKFLDTVSRQHFCGVTIVSGLILDVPNCHCFVLFAVNLHQSSGLINNLCV